LRIGHHTSIAGSLERSALEAVSIGANTFQIFSSSPRQWKASIPSEPAIKLLKKAREKYDLAPLVIHDNYLINMAAADDSVRAKSIEAFQGEIERALAIGAEYLVAHPGNCQGHSVEEGITAVVRSLVESCQGIDAQSLTVLLENTAGAGSALGSAAAELQAMREYTDHFCDLKIGYCVDTCHAFASGLDTIALAGELGMEHVHVIHANDSKGGFGSHLDRHANIGAGQIGEETFRNILRHPKLRKKAFILETPPEEDGHLRDVAALKRLSETKEKRALT